MKVVIFGLSVSSSWGNGHATLWRGLCASLAKLGHRVVFFEKDTAYYAAHRDLHDLSGYEVRIYRDWREVVGRAKIETGDADVAIVTSYCPDGAHASDLVLSLSSGVRVFYDLDTPITLSQMRREETVPYLPQDGLGGFDLVLSFTGGRALHDLQEMLGARRVAPLYGSADLGSHFPVEPVRAYESELSYLGTFSADRKHALERLFVDVARRLPAKRFVVGGSLYPADQSWASNIAFMSHVAPPSHPAFYCSSRATLNVTRRTMANMGYCPSGRLFEAAACGVPLITDEWSGLESFFDPETELAVVHTTEEVLAVLERPPIDLAKMASRARARVRAEHTSDHRARELLELVRDARSRKPLEPFVRVEV